ncbi:MAG: 50S ribosomal protein L4 [Planctomycetota bacterium]
MITLPVYDWDGKISEELELNEKVFATKVNLRLLREVLLAYEANKRQGTVDTKTRSEVEGSRRKPYPQKHTGRARAGQIRSPLWRKGGVVFGPHPRDFSQKINKKKKIKALGCAIYAKLVDKEIIGISQLNVEQVKTKTIATLLKKLPIKRTILIGTEEYNRNLYLSVRNIQGVKLMPVSLFNAYDVLKYKTLLLTKGALLKLYDKYKGLTDGNAQ